MVIGFYVGIMLWPLLSAYMGLPVILSEAHVDTRQALIHETPCGLSAVNAEVITVNLSSLQIVDIAEEAVAWYD